MGHDHVCLLFCQLVGGSQRSSLFPRVPEVCTHCGGGENYISLFFEPLMMQEGMKSRASLSLPAIEAMLQHTCNGDPVRTASKLFNTLMQLRLIR